MKTEKLTYEKPTVQKVEFDFGLNVVLPTGANVKDFGGALNLNDTAALIFEQLQAGKTVEETVAALVAAYDVSPETALADVQETIESLREAGVVA